MISCTILTTSHARDSVYVWLLKSRYYCHT